MLGHSGGSLLRRHDLGVAAVFVKGWGDGAVKGSHHFVGCASGSGGNYGQGHRAREPPRDSWDWFHHTRRGLDHRFESSRGSGLEHSGYCPIGWGKGENWCAWDWEGHTESREGLCHTRGEVGRRGKVVRGGPRWGKWSIRDRHGRHTGHADNRERRLEGWSGRVGHGDLGIGSHSSVDGQLLLREQILKMADDPHLGGLLGIQAFHAGQVVCNLCSTLAETHHAVIQESTSVAIRRVGVTETWGKRTRTEAE